MGNGQRRLHTHHNTRVSQHPQLLQERHCHQQQRDKSKELHFFPIHNRMFLLPKSMSKPLPTLGPCFSLGQVKCEHFIFHKKQMWRNRNYEAVALPSNCHIWNYSHLLSLHWKFWESALAGSHVDMAHFALLWWEANVPIKSLKTIATEIQSFNSILGYSSSDYMGQTNLFLAFLPAIPLSILPPL